MIILSEVSQRKANTACSHVYVESPKKQTELVKMEIRMVVTRGQGGRWGEVVKRGAVLHPEGK